MSLLGSSNSKAFDDSPLPAEDKHFKIPTVIKKVPAMPAWELHEAHARIRELTEEKKKLENQVEHLKLEIENEKLKKDRRPHEYQETIDDLRGRLDLELNNKSKLLLDLTSKDQEIYSMKSRLVQLGEEVRKRPEEGAYRSLQDELKYLTDIVIDLKEKSKDELMNSEMKIKTEYENKLEQMKQQHSAYKKKRDIELATHREQVDSLVKEIENFQHKLFDAD